MSSPTSSPDPLDDVGVQPPSDFLAQVAGESTGLLTKEQKARGFCLLLASMILPKQASTGDLVVAANYLEAGYDDEPAEEVSV